MNTILLNTISDGKVVIKRGEGGGKPTVYMNDVTFYDYDGTILYSYKADEFLALTELPKLDDKEGLKADGWNWTLEDAKEQVMECGMCDIGAHYVTDTGETRLYITLDDENALFFDTMLDGTGEITVDWGDGNVEVTQPSSTRKTHNYNEVGDYVIKISSTQEVSLGGSTAGGVSYKNLNALRRVEFGSNSKVSQRAFEKQYALKTISFPKDTVVNSTWYFFSDCYSLKHVTLPKNTTTLNDYCFSNCYSLGSVSIPKGVKSSTNYNFSNAYSLSSLCYPVGISTLGTYANTNLKSLVKICFPSSITSVGNYGGCSGCTALAKLILVKGMKGFSYSSACNQLNSLVSVKIPASFEKMPTFGQCNNLKVIDISSATSVIPAPSSLSFSSSCKVIVPDALYDEWIAATNWSAKASNIIKKSDWDASQS